MRELEFANSGRLRPDQVGAMTPEQTDWMQQNAPWMLPQPPAGWVPPGGGAAGARGAPASSLTAKEKGDIGTKAINAYLLNPFHAYNQMLGGGLSHEEALAAVRQRHPYPGSAQFDPDVARHSRSSWLEEQGLAPGYVSAFGDWANPWLPDFLLPKEPWRDASATGD